MTFEVSLFLQRLTIASPAYEPIYFRYPRDRESLPRSSAAGFEPPAAIWVDFGTILRGSALGDAPPSTVFHAVPLHRLTASPSDLDVSDVFLDHADQMLLRSARGELLVASTCRKMRQKRRRFGTEIARKSSFGRDLCTKRVIQLLPMVAQVRPYPRAPH